MCMYVEDLQKVSIEDVIMGIHTAEIVIPFFSGLKISHIKGNVYGAKLGEYDNNGSVIVIYGYLRLVADDTLVDVGVMGYDRDKGIVSWETTMGIIDGNGIYYAKEKE